MPSILPTFEYDIFISYRHNDNRSGWVTEFVNALQEELAATIKEPLTIYFDKNPHDGLLETHNVDKSLEGKLKCLIFIPIISQTYCDTKSFAWQHEFVAFNKLAKQDQFGRDIKLNNANVASRILPIKIHDLDVEDKSLIENEIDSVLRAIEFIYKEAGVNRPLKATDSKTDNQNKTDYRNQVNKVANAIKEIITSLKNPASTKPANTQYHPTTAAKSNKKTIAAISLLVTAVIMTVGIYWMFFQAREQEDVIDKSVAVLAFTDMSAGKDQEWFSDGLSEEILNSLANLPELKVTARTSSFYFKGKDVPLQEISEKLGVAHIVEGSVRKINNQLRITVQLIRTKDEFHVWSKVYNHTANDLFKTQTDIAENIAKALLSELTPEKKLKLVESKPTSVEAYEYYLKGVRIHFDKYYPTGDEKYFKESEKNFIKAISLDVNYADAYGALADLYDSRSNYTPDQRQKFYKLRDSVAQIGYRKNPNSLTTLRALFWSQMKREKPNYDSAFYYLQKLHQLNSEDVDVIRTTGNFYNWVGLPDLAEKFAMKGLTIDPLDANNLQTLVGLHGKNGDYDLTRKYADKIIEIDSNRLDVHLQLLQMYAFQKKLIETRREAEIIKRINPQTSQINGIEAMVLAVERKNDEALQKSKNVRILMILGLKKEYLTWLKEEGSVERISPTQLKNPINDFVRNEPAFKDFEERVKIEYEKKLAKYGGLE
jgi:TolB-like protein